MEGEKKVTTSLSFATGNANKFYEASKICRKFDINLKQVAIEVDEIQHNDPLKITEAKARSAYDNLGHPVVVNDSSWDIPALGGFPGGYMKDISSWLSTDDFSMLMKDKSDKRIHLKEYVAYFDGEALHVFTHQRLGHFLDTPRGDSPPSFSKLVQMEGEDMTISEIFDARNWNVDSDSSFKHWYDFARWLSTQTP